jgi:hypothetical protein
MKVSGERGRSGRGSCEASEAHGGAAPLTSGADAEPQRTKGNGVASSGTVTGLASDQLDARRSERSPAELRRGCTGPSPKIASSAVLREGEAFEKGAGSSRGSSVRARSAGNVGGLGSRDEIGCRCGCLDRRDGARCLKSVVRWWLLRLKAQAGGFAVW